MAGEEEVTDLTQEEGDSGDKGSKKAKKEKKPKKSRKEKKAEEAAAAAEGSGDGEAGGQGQSQEQEQEESKDSKKKKDKKQKTPKAAGEKKTGSGLGVILAMLVIALLLLGSYGAALYFDFFNARAITADFVRDPILDFVTWLDPRFNTIDTRLIEEAENRENRLIRFALELDEREQAVQQLEAGAAVREEQLNRREEELNRYEDELTALYQRSVPLYRRDMTEEELEEMISYAATFTRMSPADAAEVLVRIHTIQDVASILYYMNERNRATILAALDPNLAAEVTNIWIYN